ncbi:MAG: TIR domain-containing protein [Candidatus Aminicenantes bacterium]|nr:TIR domain-containing protein [Candidatus Aminicenantes bacterium]NIN16899.1 TIR domain-containing protein [Candidatus Aminicenantes bacterium]NIN40792.1 TIR domain-containing protein [Candidatus Aminicenantes bacterium]NIN83596.1 TIR domain-containing protein [Candidatus Aminicenantes bacterium]NIO79491.1 TIR domain-containing protein [Candidatus Aminicenantes bacterium]
MFYIHPTEKWIQEVVRLMNEHQLKPDSSRFMIAFFSSLDNEFVDYFKNNKDRISSFSGKNFHIFTPLIYEGNIIPDDDWRHMRNEFKSFGIPLESGVPTFIFFSLESGGISEKDWHYYPRFFAGFACSSFNNFPTKLKKAIDACIEIKHNYLLAQKLSEIFLSENLIWHNHIRGQLCDTITKQLPKSTVFISHSNKDKQFVKKIVHDLSIDDSVRFWIDENEIQAGDDIQGTITRSLRASDTNYLILVISKNSTESSWVNFEVSQFIGFSEGKNIIPVVLSKGHHFPEPIENLIKKLKYVDFTDDSKWNESVQALKKALMGKTGK